jgi:hypothetical protein
LATTLTKPQVVVNQTKAQLEENIESITEDALPPYLRSMFSNLASANLQNAQILYNFLLTGHIEQNLALRTSLNHMLLMRGNQFINQDVYEQTQAHAGKPKCSL